MDRGTRGTYRLLWCHNICKLFAREYFSLSSVGPGMIAVYSETVSCLRVAEGITYVRYSIGNRYMTNSKPTMRRGSATGEQ